jgi:hypothetical protein
MSRCPPVISGWAQCFSCQSPTHTFAFDRRQRRQQPGGTRRSILLGPSAPFNPHSPSIVGAAQSNGVLAHRRGSQRRCPGARASAPRRQPKTLIIIAPGGIIRSRFGPCETSPKAHIGGIAGRGPGRSAPSPSTKQQHVKRSWPVDRSVSAAEQPDLIGVAQRPSGFVIER